VPTIDAILDGIWHSYSLAVWWAVGFVAVARLTVAGLHSGSKWVGIRGLSRERLAQLLDRDPIAQAANKARFRGRVIQLGIVVLGVIPAWLAAPLTATGGGVPTGAIVFPVLAACGGYLIWGLYRFEVEGRRRYRARIVTEGQARLARTLAADPSMATRDIHQR
jgi:hypothetical protein